MSEKLHTRDGCGFQGWAKNSLLEESDAAYWYTAARVAGVDVRHIEWPCHNYDSANGALGVFRRIGSAEFDKKRRRWTVRVRSDCNAAELSTAIAITLRLVEAHRADPRNALRGRLWHHCTDSDGNPVALTGLSYRLGIEDLLCSTQSARVVDWSDEFLEIAAGTS